jgi:hypothetical protein
MGDDPVTRQMLCHVMRAIWCRAPPRENVSRDEVVDFARARAVQRKLAYVLIRVARTWCGATRAVRSTQTVEIGE